MLLTLTDDPAERRRHSVAVGGASARRLSRPCSPHPTPELVFCGSRQLLRAERTQATEALHPDRAFRHMLWTIASRGYLSPGNSPGTHRGRLSLPPQNHQETNRQEIIMEIKTNRIKVHQTTSHPTPAHPRPRSRRTKPNGFRTHLRQH